MAELFNFFWLKLGAGREATGLGKEHDRSPGTSPGVEKMAIGGDWATGQGPSCPRSPLFGKAILATLEPHFNV